jgi:hypothetical protein
VVEKGELLEEVILLLHGANYPKAFQHVKNPKHLILRFSFEEMGVALNNF